MKINRNTKIVGQNIIFVPYCELHVPKYHNWMKSEELQKLTASEPLTLEQEYNMQETWREDDDKCTFIILDKYEYEQHINEIAAMIGDTNIFITDTERMIGEIEIMIAENSARRKKRGWEAVVLMLLYGIKYINIKIFEAKINMDNKISINLFNKLGFKEKSKSEIFHEVTLIKIVDESWIKSLETHFMLEIHNYKYLFVLLLNKILDCCFPS